MSVYVASDRPEFRSRSLVAVPNSTRKWATRGPVGEVTTRRGKRGPILTTAEKRKRDLCNRVNVRW